MFKRWLILLVAFLALEIAAGAYFSQQMQNTFSNECGDYLNTLSDDWEKTNNTYFRTWCDYENPFSDASLTLEYRDYLRSLIDLIVVAFISTLGVLMLSFIVRWLFTGGVR